METEPVLGLLKFGIREHMQELVREGHLYMNPLSHFLKIENDGARSDKHEGSVQCSQPDKMRIYVAADPDGDFTEVSGIVGPIMRYSDSVRKANVYCMYAVRPTLAVKIVDKRNFAFGDTFVLFTNGDEFLRRLRLAAEAMDMKIHWQLVDYVNKDTYHGPMGIFRKFSVFAYQSEFRIATSPGTGKPFSLRIGDLSDITWVGTLADLNERVKIMY